MRLLFLCQMWLKMVNKWKSYWVGTTAQLSRGMALSFKLFFFGVQMNKFYWNFKSGYRLSQDILALNATQKWNFLVPAFFWDSGTDLLQILK